MGKFSKDVRHNLLDGPNKKGFKKELWTNANRKYDIDNDDLNLIEAGLFFDDLLVALRERKELEKIPLAPIAIVKLLLSILTLHFFKISKSAPNWGEVDKDFAVSKILEQEIKLKTGQTFSPDELITGMGDGLKHMLRQLLSLENDYLGNELTASDEHIRQINYEFNLAIVYQCAVEYWLDCVGNGYALKKRDEGIEISPQDEKLETSRIVSVYRRLNIEILNGVSFNSHWRCQIKLKTKRELCKIHLISKVYGRNGIEKIELGLTNKVLDSASASIGAKMFIEHGYYGKLIKTPLPNFGNFNLDQIIDGWRLLQSLATTSFDDIKATDCLDDSKTINTNSLLKFSIRVKKTILVATFAKALNIKTLRAEELIGVFIFSGSPSNEIWSQPLISIDNYYYPIIPALISVHLLRIVETWMRQGGLDLDVRGKEFEKYCINELSQSIIKSSIKDSVYIHKTSFNFYPLNQREEEIDILIAIGDTVLLVEAKCILWPDDSLQFANYRDTIEAAAAQISRKKDSVLNNFEYFSKCLQKLGHKVKPKNIISCVLTNSAVYSGFPIDGVPIVDISILGTFFRNELIKSEERNRDQSLSRYVISFYKDSKEASEVVESFLLDPPQLSDTKRFVYQREVEFPFKHIKYGSLIHKTFKVEINAEDMVERHKKFAVTV